MKRPLREDRLLRVVTRTRSLMRKLQMYDAASHRAPRVHSPSTRAAPRFAAKLRAHGCNPVPVHPLRRLWSLHCSPIRVVGLSFTRPESRVPRPASFNRTLLSIALAMPSTPSTQHSIWHDWAHPLFKVGTSHTVMSST